MNSGRCRCVFGRISRILNENNVSLFNTLYLGRYVLIFVIYYQPIVIDNYCDSLIYFLVYIKDITKARVVESIKCS